MKARVLIRNKRGVFDPQGKVVEGGLLRLGYDAVKSVRVGKVVEIELDATDEAQATAQIDQMCAQFLVNPVIEEYSIEFEDRA